MKKVIAIIAIAIASMSIAHAQFGIIGGFTSSSTTVNTEDWKANLENISLYHVGLTYKVDLGLGLAIQPSLTYEMKGATVKEDELNLEGVASVAKTIDTKTGYAEFGLDLQWGPDLVAFRPFIFASPFIGYQLTSDETNSIGLDSEGQVVTNLDSEAAKQWAEEAKNKLEYGFGIGAGVDIMKFVQLKAQYFMNLGNLYNEGQATNIKDAFLESGYKNVENYNGIKVSLAILF
ncbi:MAG: PorT family protein [Bacteroidales bacterium]|nr:PorT family protein [Bacteroidales bacterium]